MHQKSLFCTLATSSLAPAGLFSRSRLRGTQGARLYNTRYGASLGPGRAPSRVLWAFEVAASWLFSRNRVPPRQSQAGPWKTLQQFLEYRSSPLWLGSHGTTVALQVFSFVTATNGASACVCMSVRVCHPSILEQQEPGTVSTKEVQLHYSFSLFFLFCLLLCTCSHRKLLTLWQPLCNRSRISRGSLVAATNGASVCLGACAYVGAASCTQRAERFRPTVPLNFESTRAIQYLRSSSTAAPAASSGKTGANLALGSYP